MYETALRDKYRKSAEQEAELLLEQKRKLDQYSQDLHASFRAMVSEYQTQVSKESKKRRKKKRKNHRDNYQKSAEQEVELLLGQKKELENLQASFRVPRRISNSIMQQQKRKYI
jgi:hypothetical protein